MASSSEKSGAKANLLGKREPGDDLWTKPTLKKHKEKSVEKETTEGFADSLQQMKIRVDLLETKSDQANLETVEGLDEAPDLVEEVALRKKTVFVGQLSPHTKISDIINFFKDVGEVVRVQLIVNREGKHVGCGFVEFAFAKEANKALERKKGRILLGNEITLQMAKIAPFHPQHKYCLDHKVWHEDNYFQRESLLIGENETVEGLDDEPADFAEAVLFVANLSPQTKILQINDFFNDAGEVVSVRLIVNHEGKHVGYGFVEFASSKEAKKALEKKNGEYLHDHRIFLQVVKIGPYPPQHKYNLAEMLSYEDYFQRESLLIGEDELVEGCAKPPNFDEAVAVRKKTLCFVRLSSHIEISHIISFFKDVGEVVSVRLIVNHKGKHVGYVFVEFASANEAKKALEKKNGGILRGHNVLLQMAKISPFRPPKYCLDHKVWFEDYLRESLLIEDEAVEGLDEPPDFAEEVTARRKTLFVANLSPQTNLSDINRFFKNFEVVRVQLIVDHEGEHVGCGFVEFVSSKEAKKVLLKKGGEVLRGHRTFLQVAKFAPYHPPRPKYTLAEMLWYQDYLRRESLLIEEDEDEDETKEKSEFCGKKITFSDDF